MSGNPKGRPPRRERSAAEMARDYAEDAIKALVRSLHVPSTRVPAAIALLDRGFGKPQVSIASQVDVNVLHLVAAQLVGEQLVPLEPVRAIEGDSSGVLEH